MKRTSPRTPVTYAESSAVVAALLEGDTEATAALDTSTHQIASALMPAEVRRAILRARDDGRISVEQEQAAVAALGDVLKSCEIVSVSAEILDRVGRPFAVEPVRAFEAIHLATIEAITDYPGMTTVLTRDRRIRTNALTLGCLVE